MALVRKTLLRTGIYAAPQGELRATSARVRRWAQQFRDMKAAGIRVPVAWGHQPDAEPASEEQRANQQYWLSKLNAGYLDDLQFNPDTGELGMRLDVPGAKLDERGNLLTEAKLTDGTIVPCSIREVSAGIKDWKDGTGRLWKDSIIHVALTPLPVVAGQDGFLGLSTVPEGAIYLSLASYQRKLSMADEKDDKDPEKKVEEKAADEKPPEKDETPAPEPEADAVSDMTAERYFEAGMQHLKEAGIALPEDTNVDNFWERLVVACNALKHAESMEKTETGDDAPYDNQATEQQQPGMMMSLATAATDREKALLTREQNRHRQALLTKVDRLVKRGMPVHRAEAIKARIGGYTLSLTEAGDAVPKRVDVELSIWEESLPKKQFNEQYLSQATEQERPRLEGESEDEMRAFAAERAKSVSRVG